MRYISEAFDAINNKTKVTEGYAWQQKTQGDSAIADFKMQGNPVFAEVTADERGTMARVYKYSMKFNRQTMEKEPVGDPEIVSEQKFGDANKQNFDRAKKWAENAISSKQEGMCEAYEAENDEEYASFIDDADAELLLQCALDFIRQDENYLNKWVEYAKQCYNDGKLNY